MEAKRRLRPRVAGLTVACLVAITGCAGGDAAGSTSPTPGPGAGEEVELQPVVRPEVEPSPPAEQPRNTDFESGTHDRGCPSVWECERAGLAISGVDPEIAHEGEQSIRVTVENAGEQFVMQSEAVPAEPLRSYVSSVALRTAEEIGAGAASVRLLFFDENDRPVGSGNAFSRETKPETWDTLTASARAPRKAAKVAVRISVTEPVGQVWFDTVALRHHPILEVWGGTGVAPNGDADVMTIQATTPTPGGVYLATFDAFGTKLLVADEDELATEEGVRVRYELDGPAEFDPKTQTIRVQRGGAVTIRITGSFEPTPGMAFPRVTLHDPVARSSFPVFMAAQDYQVGPRDDGGSTGVELPDRIITAQAIQRLATYFDGIRSDNGGWRIAHDKWPGDLREDPQAIGVLTQAYLRLNATLDRPDFRAGAERGLEWLVANQRDDGGYGLPWAFGSSTGHFPAGPHYPENGHSHPEGEPLAVVTIAAGNALLQGYRSFGDDRYLEAAQRAMRFLLQDRERGFRWLDADRTRGSIPYCNTRAAFPDDHPNADKHEGVLPAMQNTSVEIYNIDGGALSFLSALYGETGDEGLLVYGDAIASNLAPKVNEDGSIPYSWYESKPHSAGYAAITARGLLEYGELRDRDDWREAATRGFVWVANNGRGAILPEDNYAAIYGIDMSHDITDFVRKSIDRQGTNGSFSDGKRTRHDAVMFAILAQMLADMGG